MENNNEELYPLDSQCSVKIHYSNEEQRATYLSLKKKVIKLLFLIEKEQKGEIQIDQWFYGFVYELSAANSLCDYKLTDVITKIYGLYDNNAYKSMTHNQIKRQIMESKGILDYLIEETQNKI